MYIQEVILSQILLDSFQKAFLCSLFNVLALKGRELPTNVYGGELSLFLGLCIDILDGTFNQRNLTAHELKKHDNKFLYDIYEFILFNSF